MSNERIKVTPHTGGFRIIEKVTPRYWIHWPGLYETESSAWEQVANVESIEKGAKQ